jgi:hypothetical protein
VIVSLILTTLVAVSGTQAAEESSPVATPAGSPPVIETLVALTFSLMSFDTLEHAQFSRDRLGSVLQPLQALAWELEAPGIL